MRTFVLAIAGLILLLDKPRTPAKPIEDFNVKVTRKDFEGLLIVGELEVNGVVLGKTYENAQRMVRTGTYGGRMRYSSVKGHALNKDGELGAEGDFLLEFLDPTGTRTDLLFHCGNKPSHSKGCILLGPVQRGIKGARKVDADHPLYKLRNMFYGTNDPISCPAKEIKVVVASELKATKLKLVASGPFEKAFGGNGISTYKATIKDVEISVDYDPELARVTGGSLSFDHTEAITSRVGNPPPTQAPGRQQYKFNDSGWNGDDLVLGFKWNPGIGPKCNPIFRGTFNGKKLSGQLAVPRADGAYAGVLWRFEFGLSM